MPVVQEICVIYMDKAKAMFAIALLFLFGCAADMSELIKELKTTNLSLNSSHDMTTYPNGTCIAMICSNKTPSFPFNLFFDSSLKGGNCSFQPCNETLFDEINRQGKYPDLSIRLFMFGSGHSFLSFSDSNLYCNNSMKMSVKWLVGSNYSAYPMPTKERAECFLDKNIIPVYLLYSNSTNINASRAGEIANELNDSGPAILVSEAELDDANESRYSLVKDQIISMRAKCPKCLIALGLKMNGSSEYNVVRAIFSDSSILEKVDIVAFGLNSHYFKGCDPDLIFWYAANFSRFLVFNYTKPSLMTYVLFDQANSSDNSCTWANETVANGYSLLYLYSGTFASDGIIGASLYSFYGIGPLGCENCALMGMNSGSDVCRETYEPEKIEPRFFNYMSFCQAYYSGVDGQMSGVSPIVFPNGSRNCDFAYNSNIWNYAKSTDTLITSLVTYEIAKSEPYFSCGGCFGNGTMPTTFPSISGSSDYCTNYTPSIEIAADNFDVDPLLMRAAIWQESSFDKCEVSFVPKSSTSCNAANLEQVEDPDACCSPPTEKYYKNKSSTNTVSPCEPESNFINYPSRKGDECKPCAYGLAQVIEYPWKVYYENSTLAIPQAVRTCALKIREEGVPDFNPFRPYNGPCAYAYKFMNNNLPSAQGLVSIGANADKLDIGTDANKKEWYAAFLALYGIYGISSSTMQGWINDFYAQNPDNEDICSDVPDCCESGSPKTNSCCQNPDFMNYVKYCEHSGGFSYGYDVLTKYNWLMGNCDEKYCPDTQYADRNTIGYVCTHDYMEDECCNAARLAGYYSATYMCYVNPSTPAACKQKYCK